MSVTSSDVELVAIYVTTTLKALPPVPIPLPQLIELRKADNPHPDEIPCVIVTIGGELPPEFALQGAGGVGGDWGSIGKRYLIGISVYTPCLGDLSTNVGEHPAIVLACKRALNKPLQVGNEVWDWNVTLHENPDWERQEFKRGVEVTRFVLEYHVSEPRT